MGKLIHRFSSITFHNKWLLVQTVGVLLCVRLLVWFVPFAKLAPWLGSLNHDGHFLPTSSELHQVHRIRWAVGRVSMALPWLSNCLVQAITAKYLLSQKNIETTLFLGANLKNEHHMEAHAWLQCGTVFITGGAIRNAFQTLASFS